jgi:tetratricopeptide (TPR) repeat protein
MQREKAAGECARKAGTLLAERAEPVEGFLYAEELTALAGRVAWFEGNDEAAEAAYRIGFETWPANREFGGLLIAFLVSRGRREEAREVADQALRTRPDDEKLAAYCSDVFGDS